MEDKYSVTVRAHKSVMPSHDEIQEKILDTLSSLIRDKISASDSEAVSTFRIDVSDNFNTK